MAVAMAKSQQEAQDKHTMAAAMLASMFDQHQHRRKVIIDLTRENGVIDLTRKSRVIDLTN